MTEKKAEVILVGAGPGDPGLITALGLDYLRQADCVIYDKLANPSLLNCTRKNCRKIFAGKTAGAHYMRQDEINELIATEAQKGGTVVRLKGGDPYVFGRGGEEYLYLKARGISCRVVPGVSSAIGGLCYAGIPVTHRKMNSSFHVITAHKQSGGLELLEYSKLACLDGTLVFLMGLEQADSISNGLIAGGMSKDMPAAAVSRASTPAQKTVVSTLENLSADIIAADLKSPTLIVVGEVAALHEELSFYESLPLFGKKILVTGARKKSPALERLFENNGAETLCAPMLELREIPGAIDEYIDKIGRYQYIVFTSTETIELFFSSLFSHGEDVRALGGAKLCAVGAMTAKRLNFYGLKADIVPEVYSAKELYLKLEPELKSSCCVLLPQSANANPFLRNALGKLCRLDTVDIYEELVPSVGLSSDFISSEKISAATFTSSAAAENFNRAVGISTLTEKEIPIFSIGPSTSKTLADLGAKPIESREATLSSLADTVVEYFSEEEK